MYNKKIKMEILEKLINNETPKSLSKEYNVSLSTIYNWKNESLKKEEEYIVNRIEKLCFYGNYNKVIEVGLEFSHIENVANFVMRSYKRLGLYNDAINFWKKHNEFESLKPKLVNCYIKQGDLDNAKEIAKTIKNNEYKDSLLIKIYFIEKNYNEAYKIILKNPSIKIASVRAVEMYMDLKMYGKAKEVALKFINNKNMQKVLFSICLKRNDYENAIKLLKINPTCNVFKSKLMQIYINLKMYDQALCVGKTISNYNLIHIAHEQMFICYMKLGIVEEAKKIYLKYPNNIYMKKYLEQKGSITCFIDEQNFDVSYYLNLIKKEDLKYDEFIKEVKNLSQLQQLILKSAYVDKSGNKNLKTTLAKNMRLLKNNEEFNDFENKIINKCIERLSLNSKFFDIVVYSELFNKTIYNEENRTKIRKKGE